MKSWKKPTPDQVDKAVALLVHVEQYRYFFDRLESPEWLRPLGKKGFFRHPPQPEQQEEKGTIRFPPWPEARYLARMARHKPQLVAEIIQKMDNTENAAVVSDLVDALLAMPPEISVQLTEKAKRWAEKPFWLLPEKLGQLISHFAKGGKTEEAIAIARVLLAILPNTSQQKATESSWMSSEPQARFDVWDYEQILKRYYPDLVREAGMPALELLCNLLERAVTLFQPHENKQRPNDDFLSWRPAIEDHPQNFDDTIRDALVSAVCEAAELIVRTKLATVEEVVKALECRHCEILQRIALHVLRIFFDQAEELAADRLTDKSLFEDIGLHHEYTLLLRDCFSHLTPEDQAKILGWINDEPEARDWLAAIGPENLPEEWQKRYRKLIEKHGEPGHPEFPIYRGEYRWTEPTSPKPANELKTMSVTEIVEFLKRWKPPENVFGEPSLEGLGRVLSSVVAEDPGRFATEARAFQGTDPTYVRAVISGFKEAAKQKKTFDWKPVLDLCEWALSQSQEIKGRKVREMYADPDWSRTRKAIADLLLDGLEDHQGCIPIGFRQKVWNILKPLTDDPDPTPEREQRYTSMDPATLSLNTTRGQAMHAVVQYALWVRRNLEKEPNSEVRLQEGFEEMLEVREVLERHLDPAQEPSLAIRTVYSRWFPWLVLLDPDWTRTYASRIFSQGIGSKVYFEVAWNSYVLFNRAYDNVLDILRPHYQHVVEIIGLQSNDTQWPANPDKKLAEHLMAFYWRGKISLNDALLVTFYKNASDGLMGHAMEFVGRSLKQTEGDISAEILNRLKQLWEWRLATAKKSHQPRKFEKEIAAFGWWFVSEKFDVEWAIDQLYESFQITRKTNPKHLVLEQLARTAQAHPRESVACLRMVAEGDREGWTISGSRDHVRRILEVALLHPRAADEAKRAVHYLGSRGFLQFRELLDVPAELK